MFYKQLLKTLIPVPIKDYLKDLQNRMGSLDVRVRHLEVTVGHLQRSTANLETMVDCLLESSRYSAAPEVGFNGQALRKAMFHNLMTIVDFQYVFETGTWTGNTTGYMAETTKLRVFSTELDRRFYVIAKQRLAHLDAITLENLDSRQFIRKLAGNPALTQGRAFFYLDAHWHNDLPLREEIELIAQHWRDFVIMIDDFKVPGDEGYGYDDYGKGQALTLEYVTPALRQFDLVPFFPSKPSREDTGARRGCIVLARSGPMAERLRTAASLQEHGLSAAPCIVQISA